MPDVPSTFEVWSRQYRKARQSLGTVKWYWFLVQFVTAKGGFCRGLALLRITWQPHQNSESWPRTSVLIWLAISAQEVQVYRGDRVS